MYRSKKKLIERLNVDKKLIEDINKVASELRSLRFYQKSRKKELQAELQILKDKVREAVDKANTNRLST